MKIVLVLPPSQLGIGRFLTSGINSPHLGLASIASLLRKEGLEVRVVDAPAQGLNLAKFTELVAKTNPDLVGITAFT